MKNENEICPFYALNFVVYVDCDPEQKWGRDLSLMLPSSLSVHLGRTHLIKFSPKKYASSLIFHEIFSLPLLKFFPDAKFFEIPLESFQSNKIIKWRPNWVKLRK